MRSRGVTAELWFDDLALGQRCAAGPLAPVRPGDALRLEGEIVALAPSRSKPQGTVRMKITLFNQRDEPVYSIVPTMIIPRRPQPASGESSAMPR
jgi:hypothetical protein